MPCCARCQAVEAHFDHKIVEHDLQQYKHRGVDAVTKLMLAELRTRSLRGCSLLDVGAGIGVIRAELAKSGVANVTVVEAAPSYLDAARREVGKCYPQGSAQFVLGDFSVIAATLADADVVTLGRVVCCYPDAEALLQAAAARTRQWLASTYPRDRWYVRTVTAVQNLWRRLLGSAFRTYVHAPRQMDAVLERAGLVRIA